MKKIILVLCFFPLTAQATLFISDYKSKFLENLAMECSEIQYNLSYASTYDKENEGKYTYGDLNECLKLYQANHGRIDLYQNTFTASSSSAHLYYTNCVDRSLRKKDGLSHLCYTFHHLGFRLVMSFLCCPYFQKYITQGGVIKEENIELISQKCMNECKGNCICY